MQILKKVSHMDFVITTVVSCKNNVSRMCFSFFSLNYLLAMITYVFLSGSLSAQTGIVEISGAIKISESTTTPAAGMIRWNEDAHDFEGFNGIEWVSLTLDGGSNENRMPIQGGLSSGTEIDSSFFGHSIDFLHGFLAVGIKNKRSVSIYHRQNNTWYLLQEIQDTSKTDFGKKLQFMEREDQNQNDYLAIASDQSIDFFQYDSGGFTIAGAFGGFPSPGFADNFAFGDSEGGIWDSYLNKFYMMEGSQSEWTPCLISSGLTATKEITARNAVLAKRAHAGAQSVEVRVFCNSFQGLISNPSGGALSDAFGSAIGLTDSLLLVGAPNWDNDTLTDSGRVCLFKRNTSNVYNYIGQIVHPMTEGGMIKKFGEAIDVMNDNIAIAGRVNGKLVLFEYAVSQTNLIEQRVISTGISDEQYEIAIDSNGQLGIGVPTKNAGLYHAQGIVLFY